MLKKAALSIAFLAILAMLAAPSHAWDKEASDKDATKEKKDQDNDNDDETKTKKNKKKKKKSVPGLAELRIDEKVIAARAINLPFPGSTRTVQDLLERLDEWSENDKIGGVLMDLGPVMLSMPDVEELRGAIGRLKDSGKQVSAFINGGDANAYLLAASADEIAMAPTGSIGIPGIGRLFAYEKGYHQMMGSEFQVITAGKYKYPGFLNRREPDEHFKEEFGAILDSMFDDYVNIIAEGREMEPEKVKELIDHGLFNAAEAQQHGLVDQLVYYDDYHERLLKRGKMKRFRSSSDDDLEDINSIQDLMELMNDRMQEAAKSRKAVGPKIAVLHARGPIIDQNLGPAAASQVICRDDFAKVVDELKENDSIKAVVLRISSPGGSGYASDVIWRHLRQLDEEKPLVVSMGTVAGSGGYYLSCPGRRIFAQPTTITGSIGVLGILQSQRSALNRMDLEVAEMKRGERSNLGAPNRALNKEEVAFIQGYIDDFYDVFIERVATSRRSPESEVRKIAEGRIWSGRDALEIGLVDELGGLDAAVESAREMANIPDSAELKIVHYPRASSLGEILESISPMASVSLEGYLKASSASQLTFHQQLHLLSGRFQPLCWMATPEFAAPQQADVMSQLFPSAFPAKAESRVPWLDR